MSSIDEALSRADTLTFDCYGTLIDWSVGLNSSIEEIFSRAPMSSRKELFDAYVETEAAVESQRHRSYRQVLTETVRRLAKRFDVDLPAGRAESLAEMLPTWRPFPDTNAALVRLKERFKLGVLSNIDRDLFAATAKQFDVGFEFVVTAEEVGSYKPALGHFHRLLQQHAPAERVVHVAQSLYHDGVPAGELGISYVWINRYGHSNETTAKPLAVYPDLKSLADIAGRA